MKRKALVFILDGLGDRPHPKLNGQTPLQAAHKPWLDGLAQQGQLGLVDPVQPGLPVETHTGVGVLFGLSIKDALNLTRGPIEAAGVGLELLPGDVVMRVNFATVQEKEGAFILRDRRAGRISKDTQALCDSLNTIKIDGQIEIRVYPATQHRAVLVLRGEHLSADISDNDPGKKGERRQVPWIQALDTTNANSRHTAMVINHFLTRAHAVLQSHPVNQARKKANKRAANFLLARGAGEYSQHTNAMNILGLRCAVVAGEKTVLGLANLFGFKAITAPEFTSSCDTDLDGKISMARKALVKNDIVFVHLKGTDVAAHDRKPKLKAEFIARFDKAASKLDLKNVVTMICADHSTDSVRGEHNGDPVPTILSTPGGRQDSLDRFDENVCALGSLGRINARNLVYILLDAMDRLPIYKANEPIYQQLLWGTDLST